MRNSTDLIGNKLRQFVARQVSRMYFGLGVENAIGKIYAINTRILNNPEYPVVVKSLDGFKIQVDPRNHPGFIDKDLYYLFTYEAGVQRLLRRIVKKDFVVIDVGANIGALALHCCRLANRGKIVCYEPLDAIRANLLKNISLNGFENVQVEGTALGSSNSRAKIYPDKTERGSSSLIKGMHPSNLHDTPIDVLVRRLDDDIIRLKLKRVDVIKIDVEGYEYEVLKGAESVIKMYRPTLIMEYDPVGPLRAELDSFLSELPDYSYALFQKGKHYPSKLRYIASLKNIPTHKLATLVCLPQEQRR